MSRIKRPFSRLVPMNGFPKDVEIWNRRGEVVKKIADVPSSEGIPINGVQTGPRGVSLASRSARHDDVGRGARRRAISKNKVPLPRQGAGARSAVHRHSPPRSRKTEWRFGGLSYTEKGIALLSESDRATRRIRTWILDAGAQPRKLWERRQQDAYGNPGSPVVRRDGGGGGSGRRWWRVAADSAAV